MTIRGIVARALRCILPVLLATTVAHAQINSPFALTISSSAVDPFVNSGAIAGGLATHYLWLSCPLGLPIQTAQFDLASSNPGKVIVAFTPSPPFTNAGTATALDLSLPGCPLGPVLVGTITSLQFVPGSYCLAPSSITGVASGVDCDLNAEWDIDEWLGFDFGGGACQSLWSNCSHADCNLFDCPYCCLANGACALGIWGCPAGSTIRLSCAECDPVSVDPESWGRTKAGYR
jgi:hypothetical protein